MKKWVELYSVMEEVEVIPFSSIQRDENYRYVGTDYETMLNIYENEREGFYVGCES